MKVALGFIISENLIFGTCRKGSTTDWGLVGGKVEEHETPQEAFIREALEETNIIVKECILLDIVNYNGKEKYIYVATKYDSANIKSNENLTIGWIEPEKICTKDCSYASFNAMYLNKLLDLNFSMQAAKFFCGEEISLYAYIHKKLQPSYFYRTLKKSFV